MKSNLSTVIFFKGNDFHHSSLARRKQRDTADSHFPVNRMWRQPGQPFGDDQGVQLGRKPDGERKVPNQRQCSRFDFRVFIYPKTRLTLWGTLETFKSLCSSRADVLSLRCIAVLTHDMKRFEAELLRGMPPIPLCA